MARNRTTWEKGHSGNPETQWKPGKRVPSGGGRTRGTWPKGLGIPAKGRGWGGTASGTPAGEPAPIFQFCAGDETSDRYRALRGTPEAMAKTELRNRRRDLAAATVFDVMVDSTDPFVKLAAAKDIQDRVDGKPMVRQEITGKDGVPLIDYRKLPPDVLTMLNEALDKAEAMVGHSLIDGVAE